MQELIKGSTAWVFWICIVILGIVAPLVISIALLAVQEAATGLLIFAIICHTIGAFSLKYGGAEGRHLPVRPSGCPR